MRKYFEICGTRIKLASIKQFRLRQVEYIYRPAYKEVEHNLANFLLGKKYEFFAMVPFAAIMSDDNKKSTLASYKTKNFAESLGKDVVTFVADKLDTPFNRSLGNQKYKVINQAGRKFTVRIKDIPALVMRKDGKASEAYRDTELYTKLGEEVLPAIEYVLGLFISADQEYCFFGNGIQLDHPESEYNRLKLMFDTYRKELKELKKANSKNTKALDVKKEVKKLGNAVQGIPVVVNVNVDALVKNAGRELTKKLPKKK